MKNSPVPNKFILRCCISVMPFLFLVPAVWSSNIYNTTLIDARSVSPTAATGSNTNLDTTNATALHQAGHQAFAQRQFMEAVRHWQKAASLYHQQGNTLQEAIVFANLAIAQRELGQWELAIDSVNRSLTLGKSITPVTPMVQNAIAQALDTKGTLDFAQGLTESALQNWQEAQSLHEQTQDRVAQIRNQINQARAYQRLGLFLRAQGLLATTGKILLAEPDSINKAELLHHFGNILLTIDGPANAETYLQKSQEILSRLPQDSVTANLRSRVLLDLGHVARSQTESTKTPAQLRQRFQTCFNQTKDAKPAPSEALVQACAWYSEAATVATVTPEKLNAQLNLGEIFSTVQSAPKSKQELQLLLTAMAPEIEQLPLSRNSIEQQIRYSVLLTKQQQYEPAALILAKAMYQAKAIGDQRSQIYILGTLGRVYELNQQFPEAITITREAIAASLTLGNSADDLAYQWHWQLARLLKATNQKEAALAEYNQSVEILKTIQGNLASAAANAQFSFQESIEPLYYEYVSLLLETSQNTDQVKLKRAQSVIESLKIAELANFFRNDCLTARANDITRIDQTAAVMYIIPLEDRLEVILNLPNGKLKRYTTTLPIAKLQHQVNTFQMYVQDESSQDYLKPAQTLYNWTIRPLESDLKEFKIRTLVIVSDPMLRGIPFAALHDGKKFLVEKYYLAASPGLQLLDSQMITRKQVNVLVSGLTKARHNFTPLPSVSVELEKIQSRVGKSTINVLLNETFTSENLASSLQSYPYSVVHIATHGNFSSKAANTFIIAWDRKINIEQLHQILRVRGRDQANPLEILILSACETAKGDKRSTLGLAGIAVRAGARSTIGSLWPVSDTSTSILMAGLYEKLADGRTSRAEALQFGQLELLNGKDETFRHPYYWSAFVLLGNWQ